MRQKTIMFCGFFVTCKSFEEYFLFKFFCYNGWKKSALNKVFIVFAH